MNISLLKMNLVCIMVSLMMAFAIQQTKGQSTMVVMTSPSINSTNINASQALSHNVSANVSTTSTIAPKTQSTYYHQSSTLTLKPTPSSSITISSSSASVSLNNNTHAGPTKSDDMEGTITLYLLVACVALFVVIIIILVVLVVQMKGLTNKLRR